MGFVTFEKSDIVNGRSKVIPMENAEKFLALYNCNVYWVIPKGGRKLNGYTRLHTVSALEEK